MAPKKDKKVKKVKEPKQPEPTITPDEGGHVVGHPNLEPPDLPLAQPSEH